MKSIYCLFILFTFLPSFCMELTRSASESNLYSLHETQKFDEQIIISKTENKVTTISQLSDPEIRKLLKENCGLKDQLNLTKWCTVGICTTLLVANVLVFAWRENHCTDQLNNNESMTFPYPYSNQIGAPSRNNCVDYVLNYLLPSLCNTTYLNK